MSKFESQKNYLDEDDPWSGILEAAAFVVQSMYHSVLRATPGQLVFGYDMVLNNPLIYDWEDISQGKKKLIEKNQL